MLKIKVNSLEGVGASTPAISIDNASGTCTANITNNLSNRNLVINGAMQVAQRGTSSTVSGYGSIDRWQFNYGGIDNPITQSQINVAPTETGAGTAGFRNAFRLTNGDQTSGFGATDYFQFQQFIEDQNIANSGWIVNDPNSFITVSYWIRSSVAQEFFGFAETYHGDDWMYGWSTGTLTADTWTKITKTIPGRSNLTWGNDNGAGLLIAPITLWGTNYTDSSVGNDAWHQYFSSSRTPDATSTWWTTNGATVDITGVQVEVGSVATEFEHRTFGQELALCQRYCQVFEGPNNSQGGDSQTAFSENCTLYQANNLFTSVPLKVSMRAKPSMSFTTGTNYYVVYSNGAGYDLDGSGIGFNGNSGTEFLVIQQYGTSLGSAGNSAIFRLNNTSAKITLSAEL